MLIQVPPVSELGAKFAQYRLIDGNKISLLDEAVLIRTSLIEIPPESTVFMIFRGAHMGLFK